MTCRPVYYQILDHFVQRSQYIFIKIPLHKQSENVKMCYARQSTACNFLGTHGTYYILSKYICYKDISSKAFFTIFQLPLLDNDISKTALYCAK